ncbi:MULTISPECIES: fructosamine kinase family protein [unclassified Frondihabitans]|uniref:fructosamine kinase family protein n=1 Tax=unclassified Frondihabitans TaxID=2626248 RepID=UPI000F4D3CED|nr:MULTISPECIES: fructosamine kinase family protein [unclassified Frondihabitans]RPE74373.1 fructosamine-3-kinase [Frondihabitans sp. PhB153]RPF02802.1 fructosamine-3-kinase [Frondihabitans sp. PhB161]
MSFIKTRPDAPDGFFEAEAAGLAWLGETTADGGARVAGVDEVAPGRIALEEIHEARPTVDAARAFGAALAVTHAAGAAAFGAPPTGWSGPTFIGSRPMRTDPKPTWGVFYAQQRILPYVEIAVKAGTVTETEERRIRDTCDAISHGAFDDGDAPSRLHGDLWAGNVLFSAGGVVLIDPAAHGGHRETDLAMLALFGCPFLDDLLAAYDAAAPLRAGWQERVPLHQLHPLAVHAAGHGRSYGVALARAADATLDLLS